VPVALELGVVALLGVIMLGVAIAEFSQTE
jgi:hypothetical protein